MATQNYIVMEAHRKLLRQLFINEDMKSERKFWMIIIFQAFSVSCLFRSALYVDGIPKKVEILAPSFCWGIAVITHALAFLQRRAIFGVLSELQQHYERHKGNPKDRAIIMACHDEGYRVLSVFGKTIQFLAVSFICKPFVVYGLQYFTTGEAEIQLPMEAVYPWELKGLMFLVSFALQGFTVACVLAVGLLNVSAPVFFCMAIVSYQQLARERFRDIREDCGQEEGVRLLKLALRSHQEVLDMIKAVELVESVRTFSMVFATAAVLSMSLLAITKAGEPGVIVPFAVLALCVIMALALRCFYGQRIVNEGDKLYEEIYAVPWYNYSNQFTSPVLIALMRAARSDRLTAWGFADISMETFHAVMTTAFSYVTFLYKMSE